MNKSLLFFTALLTGAAGLSAQCPVALQCPAESIVVCGTAANQPQFWNETYS